MQDVPTQAPPPAAANPSAAPLPPPPEAPAPSGGNARAPSPQAPPAAGKAPPPRLPPRRRSLLLPQPPPPSGRVDGSPEQEGYQGLQEEVAGPQPTVDQRSFELVHAKDIKLDQNEADNVVSAINRALHREGISDVRVERVRCTDTCRLLGVAPPTSTLQTLLQHRDMVLKAARTADTSISDIRPSQRRKWIRIHNLSLHRYMRKGGLSQLREELGAENGGVDIPAEVRWLGGTKVRTRYQETQGGTSSVVAAVLGEAVFNRLCRSGARLFGRRYEVDAYEETRPDAFCSRCCGWGHIAPHSSPSCRCAVCAKDHATNDHRCPVDGCKAGKGRPCPHGTTKCANCGGPHGSRADACTAKRSARQLARGWKSPSPPRRERRTEGGCGVSRGQGSRG